MKYRRLVVGLIVLLAGVLLWLTNSRRTDRPARVPDDNSSGPARTSPIAAALPEPVTAEETPRVIKDTATSESMEPVPGKAKDAARAMARAISSGPEAGPGLSPAIVLENIRSIFRIYNSRFGGNPVGTNPDITRTLNGENPAHAVFLNPEDGLRINGHGELVDNWDTPYFFHQLSRTEMEIHSAGPDRKMWTSDDLVIK